MRSKFLAMLCILAVLVGILSLPAAAETATENTFKAGFASVDLNPYWSTYSGERKPATMQDGDIMPLPMAGYGDNAHRLSSPYLYDDNGDGKISGPDGDGLHATILAIQSGEKITLFITVDLISVKSALTKQIRTAITEATGIPDTLVTVAGTHTHNGVDMTVNFTTSGEPFKSADGATSYTAEECNAYLANYKAHLISQLAEGCVQAVADLSEATMEKGTIDMLSYNDGKIMNNVRHYKQVFQDYENWFSKRTVTYVRGSSFNNDVDGNGSYDSFYNYAKSSYWGSGSFASKNGEAESVSDSDHSMHIVQFKFADGKNPIAFVNWRGHPANANKKANGEDVYQKLGGDYISSMRYALDSYGYRSAFILGAAGNLGINTSVPSKTWLSSAASAANKASTVLYGEILANAAHDLMTGTNTNNAITTAMHQIEAGPIMTSRLKYRYELNVPSELEAKAAAAAKAAYAAGTANSSYSYVYTDSTTKEKFVIASSYHANSAVGRAEYTAGQKATMELNVITVGKELAFLALPYEASDRYSNEATLETANNYNDWDKLANVLDFGTPFVITCANDHRGYVPNQLAYTYNENAKPAYKYAIGSYESQTTYAAKGEGEKIIDTLKTMMEQMEAKTEYCAYCEKTVVWTPLTSAILSTNSDAVPQGHYYLHDNLTYTAQVTIKNNAQVCLDLNGLSFSVNASKNASRAFVVNGGSRLNIQDTSENETGTIIGHGVLVETAPTGFSGGTLRVGHNAEVNFYSGTLTQDTSAEFHATAGGVVSMVGGSTFHMYGGTIRDGKSSLTSHGGNVYLEASTIEEVVYYPTFYMHDGLIANGTANGKGGNVFLGTGCSFKMYGGTITGGTSSDNSSIYSNNGILVLGGNAQINEVRFSSVPATRLRIDGDYTGSVTVDMPTTSLTTGTDVGNAYNDANIDNANITITGCTIPVKVVGDQLILVAPGAPATVDAKGNITYYADMTAAMTAYEATNSTAVKLILNQDVPSLYISDPTRDVYIDLNSYDLKALTASGEHKVYISDSATDDFTVADGIYGTLPATANAQAAPGYLKITEGNTISFHKYEERLTSVNFRANNVGIYFGSRFAGDEKVKSQVTEYGVALQANSAPTAESIAADTLNKTHAGTAGSNWQPGMEGNSNYGILLKDIMKPENGYAFNKRNASYQIYGVAYMRLADGTILLSEARNFTLKQVVEAVDAQWDKLGDNQKSTVAAMYQKYTQVMNAWSIPNLKEFTTGQEPA